MRREIRKVGVLGAGVMGSGIAAHLANANVPVLLLDIVPPELTPEDEKAGLTRSDRRFRNKFALAGIENIKTSRPALLYSKRFLPLVSVGNFEDDWDKLAECDWIIEVVVERLDIKQQVFERLEKVRRPGTIVSSNTSGLADQEDGRGTLRRLPQELPGDALLQPRPLHAAARGGRGRGDRPRGRRVHDATSASSSSARGSCSARTRRTSSPTASASTPDGHDPRDGRDGLPGGRGGRDHRARDGAPQERVVRHRRTSSGLDTMVHVVRTLREECPDDEGQPAFAVPDFITKMVENKQLGRKTKAGFFKREKGPKGENVDFTLDWQDRPVPPEGQARRPVAQDRRRGSTTPGRASRRS